MGVIGSKEQLGQIVVLLGDNSNNFSWKETNDRTIYRTSGLIISCAGKKYVLTTRSRIISCKNIVMYHGYFDELNPIMYNTLEILYQSIEYNIIILGTTNKTELDLSASELISGNYDPKHLHPSYDIANLNPVIPSKRATYHTANMNINLDSDALDYKVNIYVAKFKKSMVYDKSYVPDNYMYQFNLETNKNNLCGLCGAIIFNKKHQLIGMISKIKSKKLFVLPTKVLFRVVHDFINYLDRPNEYQGLLTLPFDWEVSKKFQVKLVSSTAINTSTGKKILKKKDKIISIDGKEIITADEKMEIFDSDYKNNIPLDIYLRQNIKQDIPINVVVMKKQELVEYAIFGESWNQLNFSLTDQPYFFPKHHVPYVNIGNLIIVQLTHELLDITMLNKIILKNHVIEVLIENGPIGAETHLFVIDCLDKTLAKKYDLPQIIPNKKQTIRCPLVTMLNNKPVRTLADITIYFNVSPFTGLPAVNNLLLKMGMSDADQFEIIL